MIRVLIIDDDHQIIVPGLKSLFRASRDGIDFVASSPSPDHAVKNHRDGNFDLIILDLYIPKTDPINNIEILKEYFPGKPIVIYTTEESSVWKRKTFMAGAKGYLTKKDDKARIKYLIKAVAEGQSVFIGLTDNEEQDKLTLSFHEHHSTLTQLEKLITERLAEGNKLDDIAAEFDLSTSRLDKILRDLRKKYRSNNNTHLVKILTEAGIIS